MPIACEYKLLNGAEFCLTDCPVNPPCVVFQHHRILKPEDIPPALSNTIDVVILDMNHGWPNLGHNSLVHLVQDAACDWLKILFESGLALRTLSFDVRKEGMIPEMPNGRFNVYLGTGGPGHINPYLNDGVREESQGIREDPSWEAPLFKLFDAIDREPGAALLAVCHTFGVMCRWTGIAEPKLRGQAKGGKSTGILENELTDAARKHPWFRHFAELLPDRSRYRIVDNRLFDLVPEKNLPERFMPIAFETLGVGGPRGEALTMLEWARDSAGVMPRIFGVNHHPEIVNRSRQLMILQRLYNEKHVPKEWYEERLQILRKNYPQEDIELALTSDYTLVAPLRFHLLREIRRRAEKLGRAIPLHEDQIVSNV